MNFMCKQLSLPVYLSWCHAMTEDAWAFMRDTQRGQGGDRQETAGKYRTSSVKEGTSASSLHVACMCVCVCLCFVSSVGLSREGGINFLHTDTHTKVPWRYRNACGSGERSHPVFPVVCTRVMFGARNALHKKHTCNVLRTWQFYHPLLWQKENLPKLKPR